MSFLPNNFNVVKMKYFVLSFIRLSKLPPVSFTKFLLLSSPFAFRIFYCMLRPKRKFAVSFRRSFLQRRTLDMLLFWSNGWLRCFVFYHSPAMTKVKNVHVYQNSLLASNYCTFFKKRKEEEDEKDMLARG